MKLKKTGLVARVAYWDSVNCPETANVCMLFLRFVWGLLAITVLAVCGAVIWVIASAVGFFFAYRFDFRTHEMFAPYKHWPKIRRHNIQPWYVILVGLGIYYFGTTAKVVVWIGGKMASVATSPLTYGIVGAIVAIVALFFIVKKAIESEIGRLARAYFRAKKEKICPIVEFTD